MLECPQWITWPSHRSAGCHKNTNSSVPVWCFWRTSKTQCLVNLTHILQNEVTWPVMLWGGVSCDLGVCDFSTLFFGRTSLRKKEFCCKRTFWSWSRNNWLGQAPYYLYMYPALLCVHVCSCFISGTVLYQQITLNSLYKWALVQPCHWAELFTSHKIRAGLIKFTLRELHQFHPDM